MGIGTVHIVGAGPGAPDLITVRGANMLRRADMVIVDSLLPATFLDDLGISTTGKSIWWLQPSDTRERCREIGESLCAAAREGKTVVRLKGGDPFVFGRFEEELGKLSAEEIHWEIVPGLSSATAGPTAAGLPLTRRGGGRSFAVVTARRAGGPTNESYPRADTLVVLMAVSVMGDVTRRLLDDGWSPETPAAVLERTTLPWERRVDGVLADIASRASAAGVRPPALLVIGSGASAPPAVAGKPTILFTGLDPAHFRALGRMLHWPALQVVQHEPGWRRFGGVLGRLERRDVDWIVFTSRIGVRFFFDALAEHGRDARLLGGARVGAVGAGTAAELVRYGIVADMTPRQPGSRGLQEFFKDISPSRLVIVQGGQATDDLVSELRRLGHWALRLPLHTVLAHPELGRTLPQHDVIYFISPSGVRAYWDTYGAEAFRREVWCIGDVTRAELTRRGIEAKVVNPNVPENQNAKVASD